MSEKPPDLPPLRKPSLPAVPPAPAAARAGGSRSRPASSTSPARSPLAGWERSWKAAEGVGVLTGQAREVLATRPAVMRCAWRAALRDRWWEGGSQAIRAEQRFAALLAVRAPRMTECALAAAGDEAFRLGALRVVCCASWLQVARDLIRLAVQQRLGRLDEIVPNV